MCQLDQAEIDKLEIMFEGDKSRDASPSIRGFLFQDYIVINSLLQNGVECVCSEYLEDVDVFFENGNFEFIQAKHYPGTDPKQHVEEIFTDLYYQYLRLQLLHSGLTAYPKLYIHTNPDFEKLLPEEVKKVMPFKSTLRKTATYPNPTDTETWLRKNVYTKEVINKQGKKEIKKQTKAEQKNSLFTAMASEASLDGFSKAIEVKNLPEIRIYRDNVMNALAASYPNPTPGNLDDNWQMILLGIALNRIHQRYLDGNTDFLKLRVLKKEFDQHMRNSVQTKSDQTIASYLTAVVAERYAQIMNDNNNTLSALQAVMLKRIYKNTVKWIGSFGANPKSQHQLLNTLSREEIPKFDDFENDTIDNKLLSISRCTDSFIEFLEYLWKIMLDLCQDNVAQQEQMDNNTDLFDPTYYIDDSVKEYICLQFREDKTARYSVILPSVTNKPERLKRILAERMTRANPKPEKWYLRNYTFKKGRNTYPYNVANISENPTVVDTIAVDAEEYSFYIECMECIDVDDKRWHLHEDCKNCIFSDKCAKGGKK